MTQQALHPIGDFREIEDTLNRRVDIKTKILAIAEKIMPLLEGDANIGDVVGMLKKSAPVAMYSLIDVAMNAKSDSVRARASTDILYMAGHKPVEKSVNITESIDRMGEEQLDAYLANALTNISIKDRSTLIHLIQNTEGEFEAVPPGQLAAVAEADIPEESL